MRLTERERHGKTLPGQPGSREPSCEKVNEKQREHQREGKKKMTEKERMDKKSNENSFMSKRITTRKQQIIDSTTNLESAKEKRRSHRKK